MLFKALNDKEEDSYIYSHTTKHLNFTVKSKRSQSALEYMMTYGWAILIIVIVAVILYSMGIFNPSSSITTTITGFQKTPISSAIFTDNGGLSLSVQNSVGYPIKITNITATTLTGGKVIIEPNITLLPGKSQVLVLSKVFTAANQGSHISTAVTITYKETSQQLPGPYISTGSITGSTPTVIYPANYTFAAVSKLTITNKQSSATPSPFQQMVNITSADNGWQLISNGNFGQNVEFFYSNGTIIPSWLESYTGSNAIWWLKLGSIPASSSITVYMGIAPTSTNLFNTVNDGEAPQIPCGSTQTSSCSNYAEYDDGVNVFNNYWNFGGVSLPNPFITLGNKTELTINNGITLDANSFISIETNTAFPIDNILEINMINPTISSEFSNGGGIMYVLSRVDGIYNSTGVAANGQGQWIYGGCTTSVSSGAACNFSFAQIDQQLEGVAHNSVEGRYRMVGNLTKPEIMGVASEYTGTYIYRNDVILNSTTIAPRVGNYYIVVGAGGDSLSSELEFSFNWLRTRAYPPNGVMPSVSFGSVS